jgi:hypothetical protein
MQSEHEATMQGTSGNYKLSNFPPRALLEVPNVFNSTNGPSLTSLVSNLNYALHEKDD